MSTTINRCSNCGHKDGDHSRSDGSHCSMGACLCRDSASTVKGRDPEEVIPTFPAFNMQTGKWGGR